MLLRINLKIVKNEPKFSKFYYLESLDGKIVDK
jgi:hypothetical protein